MSERIPIYNICSCTETKVCDTHGSFPNATTYTGGQVERGVTTRSLEDALAHAQAVREGNRPVEPWAMLLLADEVLRLRKALEIRDSFLSGDEAAKAFQEVCYFLDPHFTGAKGRRMTVEEVCATITELSEDVSRLRPVRKLAEVVDALITDREKPITYNREDIYFDHD